MNKTKIEWCDATWNPVTGEKNMRREFPWEGEQNG
jgi:protein gp37